MRVNALNGAHHDKHIEYKQHFFDEYVWSQNGTKSCEFSECVNFECTRASILLLEINSHWHINRQIRSRIRLQCDCITLFEIDLAKKGTSNSYICAPKPVTPWYKACRCMIQSRKEYSTESVTTPNTYRNAWITVAACRSVRMRFLFCMCLQLLV